MIDTFAGVDSFRAIQLPDHVEAHGIQPEDIPCIVCGDGIPHVWSSAITDWRWVRGNSPHEHCKALVSLTEREAASLYASKLAGVPVGLRTARIDNPEKLAIQNPGESDTDFICRVKVEAARIGLLSRNQEAYRLVSDWHPGKGWLYIEGPTGTGKSLVAAALCNRMVQPVGEDWTEYSEEEMAKQFGPLQASRMNPNRMRAKRDRPQVGRVLYITAGELERRMELSWTKDKTPLAQLSNNNPKEGDVWSLLILDDFGSTKASGAWQERLERLVCARYANALCTVFTSNVPIESMCDPKNPHYGARVGSRLSEMVGRNAVALKGPDWRLDYTPKRKAPRPELDRKAAASGEKQRPDVGLFGDSDV